MKLFLNNDASKILIIGFFVMCLILNSVSVYAEEQLEGIRCCAKPATHTTGGRTPDCCNGPNDANGRFSKKCCEAKGGTAKKRNGKDICCKIQNPQNS